MGDNVKNNYIRPPKDINLPFFAYGILKPGEIAYSRIKDCIYDKNEVIVHHAMKHRDGVPILMPKENDYAETSGFIFYFNDNEEAYKKIGQVISYKLYRWGTIKIGSERVNVLFGKNPLDGSNNIESPSDRNCYTGRNDPLFKEGLELVKENLKLGHFNWEKGFFNLQMNYMLLWSAIDRYCKLKYNRKKEHENREELSNDKLFIDALEKYAGGKHYRTLFTADDLSERVFDLEDPLYCLNYYYTLRCNIVHRGKTSMRDIDLLEEATNDLLNIFEYILKKTFNEE